MLDRLTRQAAAALADLEPGSLLVAAVSGGADSMAMLLLLAEVAQRRGLRLEVAHLDHGLRPDAADTARFVRAQARALGLRVHVARADVAGRARASGSGIEAAGRAARHELLAGIAKARGAAAVALAHTLDDRAETLLLNLLRGSGSAGLGSMRERALGLYRRPLLGARRQELREFLASLGAAWREDPSNLDLRYVRNRLRHEVLPRLAAINPRVVEALGRAAATLAEEDEHLAAEAESRLGRPGRTLPVAKLLGLPPALRRRAALAFLRRRCGFDEDLGAEHIDAVLGLAAGGMGGLATDLPGGLRLVRRRGAIQAVPADTTKKAGPGKSPGNSKSKGGKGRRVRA